jgi:anaerobic ribonucleoside-triphosphate reductase activating protein
MALKYVDTRIVFQEVPDEIALAISISGCPIKCPNCHSSYLSEYIGKDLTEDELLSLIKENDGITCVCFMGGDMSPSAINELAYIVKDTFPTLKVAWYSGRDYVSRDINPAYFDYIKIGPYIEEKGGLDSPTTNQRMYRHDHYTTYENELTDIWTDITFKFRKNET